MAFAMQQLLISWILIGILLLPADRVGIIQAIIGLPGVLVMLLGGANADRSDPRRLLIGIYLFAPIFPLFLIAMDYAQWFNVWSVIVWGLGIGIVQSYSMPAQQAILNRISGSAVQQGVAAATAVGFLVQILGLAVAGQVDRFGVSPVLFCQGVAFALAAWTVMSLHQNEKGMDKPAGSAVQGILEGLRATLASRVITHVLVINFVSSIFNAGAFMTVFPFIVKRVYAGDAFDLAGLMVVFFFGAAVSNALIMRFMPLLHPGKVYLVFQFSRVLVLALLYVKGDWWLLTLAMLLWGFNMGITSNLARTIVQESALAEFRGRILSVFSVSMVGSAPIGAVVLGWLIETFGTLNALLPAMVVSVVLFVYGIAFTDVWRYRSPQAEMELSQSATAQSRT